MLWMFLYTHAIISLLPPLLIFMIAVQKKHFLIILLTLEAITLITASFIALASGLSSALTPFLIIFVLTIAATEASLGLAILVSITRQNGRDSISNLTLLKC